MDEFITTVIYFTESLSSQVHDKVKEAIYSDKDSIINGKNLLDNYVVFVDDPKYYTYTDESLIRDANERTCNDPEQMIFKVDEKPYNEDKFDVIACGQYKFQCYQEDVWSIISSDIGYPCTLDYVKEGMWSTS